jgi:hypothetical protein
VESTIVEILYALTADDGEKVFSTVSTIVEILYALTADDGMTPMPMDLQ